MEIKVSGLKKKYGNRTVLDIDELTIYPETITAVVGQNGAGKTTLLMLAAGLLKSDGGTILYDKSTAVPYRRMTMVFQKPYLLSATVRKNISWPLKVRGMKRKEIESRVARLSRELGLEDLLERRADSLSSGEAQKTALARAMSFEPKLLFLDEPGANIDPESLKEMENLLMKMKEEKKTTVVLVTHNLAQARRLADRVVFMQNGKIVEETDADCFFTSPRMTETKRFLEYETVMKER